MPCPWLLSYYSGVSLCPYKCVETVLARLDYKRLITQVKRDTFNRMVLIVDYDGFSCYVKMSEEVLEEIVVGEKCILNVHLFRWETCY